MGKSADQVRREIEQTRDDLGDNLEELGERVSPKRMVQRRTERIRTGFKGVRDSVMGMAPSPPDGEAVADAAKARAGQVADRVSDVTDQVKAAPDMVVSQTQGNPMVAGLLAFGAGFLIGSVLPATDPERQAADSLKQQLEPVQERAKEIGQSVASDLQESAEESVERVTSQATQAAERVKDEAQGSVETVKREAKGASKQVQRRAERATRQVKSTATSSAKRAAPRSGGSGRVR